MEVLVNESRGFEDLRVGGSDGARENLSMFKITRSFTELKGVSRSLYI